MKFTICGEFVDESFRFAPDERKQTLDDLSLKHAVSSVELFLIDCEQIIIFWLSIQDPKTLDSEYRTRLLNVAKKAKALHTELVVMPVDCADSMNAESMVLGCELSSFTDKLEGHLILLQSLSARCLDKLQLKSSEDRRHIKHLVKMIIKAYVHRFDQLPKVSKNDTNTFFKFLQGTIADAIGEQIGFDLYRDVLKSPGISEKT